MPRKTETSEHAAWRSMIARCHRETAQAFADYGGRGIIVCERWRESFEAFMVDMGPRPPGTWLERNDNNGNYEPGNCRWATPREQAQNRRSTRTITCFGETLPLVEWARRTGISRVLISHRLRAGWTTESALTTKPSKSANSRWRRSTKEECIQ